MMYSFRRVQRMALLQVKYEVVLFDVVLPQILLHVLFLLMIQVVNHVFQLAHWRQNELAGQFKPFLLI